MMETRQSSILAQLSHFKQVIQDEGSNIIIKNTVTHSLPILNFSMMKAIKSKQMQRNTQPSFFSCQDFKELPLVYNVSSVNYCGLRTKKRFVERYLLSKESTQFYPNTHHDAKAGKIEEGSFNQGGKSFKVSPIKIHDNSPVLIRERMKTEYPKVRIYRHSKTNNQKSVYKPFEIEFLQRKNVPLRKTYTKNPSRTEITREINHRPVTANIFNEDLRISLRRTKTLEIPTSIPANKPKEEIPYTLKGWQHESPQYD